MGAGGAKDLGEEIGCAVEHLGMLFKRWICIEKALKLNELGYRLQRSSVLLDNGEQIETCRLRQLVAFDSGILSAYSPLWHGAVDWRRRSC